MYYVLIILLLPYIEILVFSSPTGGMTTEGKRDSIFKKIELITSNNCCLLKKISDLRKLVTCSDNAQECHLWQRHSSHELIFGNEFI